MSAEAPPSFRWPSGAPPAWRAYLFPPRRPMLDTGYSIRPPGYQIPDTRYRIPDQAQFRISDFGFRICHPPTRAGSARPSDTRYTIHDPIFRHCSQCARKQWRSAQEAAAENSGGNQRQRSGAVIRCSGGGMATSERTYNPNKPRRGDTYLAWGVSPREEWRRRKRAPEGGDRCSPGRLLVPIQPFCRPSGAFHF
jgi:hypothetical protein